MREELIIRTTQKTVSEKKEEMGINKQSNKSNRGFSQRGKESFSISLKEMLCASYNKF